MYDMTLHVASYASTVLHNRSVVGQPWHRTWWLVQP